MSTITFTSISSLDLVLVSGGQAAPAAGGSFADYTNSQRAKTADAYKQVVCTTAGIKGAPDLAGGVYGAGASDTDKIRASEMLNKYCQGGSTLPTQAPKSPF
jgi:hypothetical protein